MVKRKGGTVHSEKRMSNICTGRSLKLTLWSLSGGKTIVLSIVLSTIFHSSLRTRFSTVFSQIFANNIKLWRSQRTLLLGWHLQHMSQPELTRLKASSNDALIHGIKKIENLWLRIKAAALGINLAPFVQTWSPRREEGFCISISLRKFSVIPHWPLHCFDKWWEWFSELSWSKSVLSRFPLKKPT